MITVYVFSGKHKVEVKDSVAARRKTSHPIESNPLVRFFYPCKEGGTSFRTVRLIGANDRYYVGLDVCDKNRYKKFLRSRATHISLVEFNTASIS